MALFIGYDLTVDGILHKRMLYVRQQDQGSLFFRVMPIVFFRTTFLALLLSLSLISLSSADMQDINKKPSAFVPILLYHRFGPTVADSMTVTTNAFETHLKYISEKGYVVIRLRQLVDYYLIKTQSISPRTVVITVDDGHRSVYTEMFPLIKKYQVPVTLFIYPSAISNAPYAMTWDQLREMKESGLVDFQSHTYWHPNFKKERKRLSPSEYEKFVDMQLLKSKTKIEKELGVTIDMLAWPFGIYDKELIVKAARAGYIAAFTMVRNKTGPGENVMALPRYLITASTSGKAFGKILDDPPL